MDGPANNTCSLPKVVSSSTIGSGLPIWFEQGHLRDDVARRMQEQAAFATFLSTMKKPEEGMRAESSIRTTDGKWFRLSGMVTWVGDPPSLEQVQKTESLFMAMANLDVGESRFLTQQEKLDCIQKFFGSVPGQQIKTVSRLTEMHAPGMLPIRNHDVLELTYRFHDTMFFPWIVEELRVLTDDEVEGLPPFFYTYYEGCTCPRCADRGTIKRVSI